MIFAAVVLVPLILATDSLGRLVSVRVENMTGATFASGFWESVFSTVGLAAIVSGSVSAVVNYVLTDREFKKQRRTGAITDKLALYSFMIFHLDKMKLAGDALRESEGGPPIGDELVFDSKELESTITNIDGRLENQLYLLNYDILKEWIYLKTLTYEPTVKPHVVRLRTLLIKEYNDVIGPKYSAIVGEEVDRIP